MSIDRFIAMFLMGMLLPLLMLLLLITFLVEKCNPVFIQMRTVSGKEHFIFYKIRSMSKNAPNVPTGEFSEATKYINRWGKFIRMYSLDELLNLWCIIRGDMNFIGPRPIMINEDELIYMRSRHGVVCKAGITGLAQINGRDKISISKKVACERYYSRHKKSIKLKIYIIYRTIVIVLTKVGITH